MTSPVLFLRSLRTLALAGLALAVPFSAADSWPDYRGSSQDGHAGTAGLPLKWSESENVKWKTEIPLLGLSSPIVMDNQVWLTTATEDGHDFHVLCLDATTGKILANEKLFHSDDPQSMGNGAADNSYPLARHRTRTRLRTLRSLRHRLPRHRHPQGPLETRRPEMLALPRRLLLARAV
jgi:hypothetical protein